MDREEPTSGGQKDQATSPGPQSVQRVTNKSRAIFYKRIDTKELLDARFRQFFGKLGSSGRNSVRQEQRVREILYKERVPSQATSGDIVEERSQRGVAVAGSSRMKEDYGDDDYKTSCASDDFISRLEPVDDGSENKRELIAYKKQREKFVRSTANQLKSCSQLVATREKLDKDSPETLVFTRAGESGENGNSLRLNLKAESLSNRINGTRDVNLQQTAAKVSGAGALREEDQVNCNNLPAERGQKQVSPRSGAHLRIEPIEWVKEDLSNQFNLTSSDCANSVDAKKEQKQSETFANNEPDPQKPIVVQGHRSIATDAWDKKFWRQLSNLSQSITEQRANCWVNNARGRKPQESDENEAQLAPEVVGYIARLRETQGCVKVDSLLNNPFKFNQNTSEMTIELAGTPADPSEGVQSATLTGQQQQAFQQSKRMQTSSSTGSGRRKPQEARDVSNMENSTNEEERNRSSRTVELQTVPTAGRRSLTNERQEAFDGKTGGCNPPGDQDERESKFNRQEVRPESEAQVLVKRHSDQPRKHEELQLSSIDQVNSSSNNSQPQQKQSHQVKLSITTTTATTTHSSASSLNSCILSESNTSVSEVRLKWSKKMDFLLSIIGFAVDLANIWRFPYLVYKNGGGVFLIPYLIMLVFGGIPLFFLELCLGQFVKKGPITVWNKIFPYMKGVGYCSILISWYVSFYYNVLIAWSVYFIYRSISSFGHKMPWEDCDNDWNSKSGTCVSISQLKSLCSDRNETLESCRRQLFSSVNVTSPASEFFVKELSQIDQSSGLDDMGYLRPELVVCTMIVYLLHYFSLFRGLETSGKVVWVTATAPYMILSILLVRGLFLPGASMGIEYYLSPRLEKLADPQVWIDAAGQVFYSIGVGFGVHLTYASFNSHNNNCYRDCLMTSAVNALTSVYSGLVVFVYLGYMATNLGIEIDKVASEGYSLVFEVYPEALTTLPFARFWSILFFIMLLTLGIDSAMGGLEAVITGLEDEFRFARRLSRGQLTGLVIVSSFLPALISCTQGGAYTLFWFDIYSAGVSLLFSALFETIGVVYCYGLEKFIVNIESMLGRRPQLFYILCWKYISPTFLFGIIFMSIYTASTPVYRGYTFPLWSIVLGWCLAFSSVAAIPVVALLTWCRHGSTGHALNTPSKSPRKSRATSGAGSVASGATGGTRKSPSNQQTHHQEQQSHSDLHPTRIFLATDSQKTMTTAIITSSTQGEHPHRHYTSRDMSPQRQIHDGKSHCKDNFREHML